MFCSNCGNKIENDAQFCGKCGTSIKVVPDSKKEKFWPVSAESVFGMRWIRTPKAKIITGIVMICLAPAFFSYPDLNTAGVIVTLFVVGGVWYIYKGFKGDKGVKD